MALTIEDGTIVSNANSYVTAAEAETFFDNRFETLWTDTADDDAKDAALVRAALYMRQKWRLRWMGSLVNAAQAMDWPRRGVPVIDFFDPFYENLHVPLDFQDTRYLGESEIPTEVKQAQMLLALYALATDGQTNVTLQGALGRMTKREKAGSLEVEYFGSDQGGDQRMITIYWEVQEMLRPFLKSNANGTVLRS
jgi:hypothetical protein